MDILQSVGQPSWGEFNQKDGAPVDNPQSEKVYHTKSGNFIPISEQLVSKQLYDKLNHLGLIPNSVRNGNVGRSDYSKHFIQPWSIWIDYNLNAFDADIVKRVLRTKAIEGKTETEARIEDYEKIKHICDERIRQLSCMLDEQNCIQTKNI